MFTPSEQVRLVRVRRRSATLPILRTHPLAGSILPSASTGTAAGRTVQQDNKVLDEKRGRLK